MPVRNEWRDAWSYTVRAPTSARPGSVVIPNPRPGSTGSGASSISATAPSRPAATPNPDGELGGWVADTAHADPDCLIGGPDAVVFGNTRVFGASHVLGRARVLEYARVAGVGTVLAGDAEVSGSASVVAGTISESAVVTGHSRVHNATIHGGALVTDSTSVNDRALVQDRAMVAGRGFVTAGAMVTGETTVEGPVRGETIVLDGHVPTEAEADPIEAERRSA